MLRLVHTPHRFPSSLFFVPVYGTSGFRQVAVSSELIEARYNIREVQELPGYQRLRAKPTALVTAFICVGDS